MVSLWMFEVVRVVYKESIKDGFGPQGTRSVPAARPLRQVEPRPVAVVVVVRPEDLGHELCWPHDGRRAAAPGSKRRDSTPVPITSSPAVHEEEDDCVTDLRQMTEPDQSFHNPTTLKKNRSVHQ